MAASVAYRPARRPLPASLMSKPVLYAMVVVAMVVSGAQGGSVKHYKWKVDYQYWSPDCVEKVIISINGQYPGPTIRVREGDTIVVEMENLMPTEAVIMHWHGMQQRGTPWYDGAGGVSQCAINPGETFVYRFQAEKAGTYFYHGHLGLQRTAGFYGSLIVDVGRGVQEAFEYDGELSILLNDWWHRSAIEQGLGLYSDPFRWVGEPQSLLMEGRGKYNCSLVSGGDAEEAAGDRPRCDETNKQCKPLVLRVQPGLKYRLRLASVTSLSSLNFQIEDHNMTLVEADGNYVEEVVLDNLNLYSGESYSVLIEAYKQPPGGRKTFWVTAHVQGRLPKTTPALAILVYGDGEATTPVSSPPLAPAAWNDTAFSLRQSRMIVAKKGTIPPPASSDQQIILLNTQNRINGVIKWAINNISLVPPTTPFLPALKFGLKLAFDHTIPPVSYPMTTYDIFSPPKNPNANFGTQIYRFPFNSTVDIILQNANSLTVNNSEVHPWHMHGHDFWVLGYGHGKFNPEVDPQAFNLKNPPLRNTVPLYPYGWTALRFVANNPGAWFFHCHVEAHLHMGMGIVFAEGIEHLDRLPRSTMGCGLTKTWLP
ncbi:hypothetical protein KP509_20G005200 [Ceratopteris richardii]|uniref:L-ascorbate oxidase n=1 Tax=Ceratopteris richardii TaxID=49495 RepID=A0A8T2SCL5_CERRI|nr:hypothetical protein KP509_20G005200 [Ceratopteris richardii]